MLDRNETISDQEFPDRLWIRRLLNEHPAMLISLLYFIASLIGLLYSWAFMRAFEINVFRYADISDFLLASLKEPMTWLLAFGSLVAVATDNALSLRAERKGPRKYMGWYASPVYRRVNYFVLVLLTSAVLVGFAYENEKRIRSGQGEIVTVHLSEESAPRDRVMLGTTARYVFLFDAAAERVEIYPAESILMISKPSLAESDSDSSGS